MSSMAIFAKPAFPFSFKLKGCIFSETIVAIFLRAIFFNWLQPVAFADYFVYFSAELGEFSLIVSGSH